MAGMSPSPSKIDQFVAEFFAKVLHIILEARVPFLCSQVRDSPASSSGSSSSFGIRSRDRWFNLVLGECPAAYESVEPWRRSIGEPMVVDILLVRAPGWLGHRSRGTSPGRTATGIPDSWSGGEGGEDPASVLERWVISLERSSSRDFVAKDGGRSSRIDSGVYKRAIIVIRSLYSLIRMLPAHRLFHLANSSSQSRSFNLAYRVSATPPSLTESEESSMMLRSLAPIDTPTGRLCVSVAYRHTTTVTAMEVTPPILPRIITDYVGSPTTDPLRRLPAESLSGSMPSGGISGRRDVHVVSLPSSVPSSPSAGLRRHSWGGAGLGKVSPASFRSRSPSPSAQDYPHQVVKDGDSPSPPRFLSPLHYAKSPQSCPQSLGLQRVPSQPIPIQNRRWASPAPSSLSPSPPGEGRYRHSAPVNIPRPSSGLRGVYDRNALPPPSPRRTIEHTSGRTGAEVNAARLSISSLAESMLFISPPHPYHGQQAGGDDKPGDGPPSGVKRSLYGSSARIALSRSRSSSKITSEEVDDDIFACPFAVDDDETEELRTRSGSPRNRSLEVSGPRSKDAAVGALVRVLKTAPPLHAAAAESPSPVVEYVTTRSKSRPIPGTHRLQKYRSGETRIEQLQQQHQQQASSGAKSIAQALEEMREYREMREFLLLRQGGAKCTEKRLPSRSTTNVP